MFIYFIELFIYYIYMFYNIIYMLCYMLYVMLLIKMLFMTHTHNDTYIYQYIHNQIFVFKSPNKITMNFIQVIKFKVSNNYRII